MQLKVMSYNIHQCTGTDGITSVDRVAGVIHQENPDILALQEVRILQEGGLDILNTLSESSGYHVIPGPTMNRPDSSYGNALLLKTPPKSSFQIPLAIPGREPRGAIQAFLEQNGKKIQVVATHLGLSPGERRQQVKKIITLVKKSDQVDLLLLCGDMNEWLLWGRPLRWLHSLFLKPPHQKTFPARGPLLALDRIWISPLKSLQTIKAVDTPTTRTASDHLPLIAKIQL